MSNDKKAARPGWAAAMAVSDYTELLRELRAVFARRSEIYNVDEEGLHVRSPDGATERYGLDNLSREFTTCRKALRGRVVRSFVESMLGARQRIVQLNESMRDFAKVQARVKLRLHPPSYVRQPGMEHIVHWEPVEGLIATLVCDFDDLNCSVGVTQLAAWPVSRDEAVQIALRNVREKNPVEMVPPPPQLDLAPVFALEGGGVYTATHALMLGEHLDELRPLGFLVAIPARDMVLYHVIRDRSVHEAMTFMANAAQDLYERSAGCVSNELFWWHQGKLSRIPAVRVGERFVVDGTKEFGVQVIEKIIQQGVN